ncbi:MAG TPA: hypothetical protein DEH11_13070 [Actinobacteria bacterium]|nr:hypothetical protein [Actinomycetota bacterium]
MVAIRLAHQRGRSALTVPARTPPASHRTMPPIISDSVGGRASRNRVSTETGTVSDSPRLPCSSRPR